MKLILLFFLLTFFVASEAAENESFGSAKAITFVNSLTEDEKQKALFPFNEMTRYDWHYLPSTLVASSGIPVKDLNKDQKQLLDALLQTYLSEEGYQSTKDIMGNEYFLKETESSNPNRLPENYFVSVYGVPGKDKTWGWRVTGHHVSLNYTFTDNHLSFTPLFFGAFPAVPSDGSKKGKQIARDQQDLGLLLMNSFSNDQKQKAIIQLKEIKDKITSQQLGTLNQAGIIGYELTHAQKTVLNKLIVTFLMSAPKNVAKMRMEKIIREDLNLVSFEWAGETSTVKPHYFRIKGKSFLIELDNTQNSANHIHTAWSDFNGDVGANLLSENLK